jgi:hypothetical protein
MLKSRKSQQGMTAIGILMILVLCGFILMIVIKLFPAYMESFKIDSALEGLTSDSRVQGASDAQVKDLILKKLQVDDVDEIKAKDIQIVSEGSKRKVYIDYERRVHMMGNVDAVVTFGDNAVEIGY